MAKFIKLKDGESVQGVLRGDTRTFFQVYDRKANKYSEVEKGTQGAAFRFRVNLIVKGDDGWEANYYEGGWNVFKDISALDKIADISGNLIVIKRVGTGLATVYEVSAGEEVPADVLAKVNDVALLDLAGNQDINMSFGPKAGAAQELPF